MNPSSCLFLIKPDGVEKDLFGPIYEILINNGLTVDKYYKCEKDVDHWKQYYIDHKNQPFYEDLCNYMAGKEVIPMKVTYSGSEPCWRKCRILLGATDPSKADSGTIRSKYGQSIRKNVAHASDSDENALRELDLYF